jgi:hypothetical protein
MPISVILEVVYRAEDNLEGSINSIIKTVHPLYLIYICCSCAISGIGYNQQNSESVIISLSSQDLLLFQYFLPEPT